MYRGSLGGVFASRFHCSFQRQWQRERWPYHGTLGADSFNLLLAGVLEGSISTAPRVLARIAGNVVSGTLFFGPGVLGRLRGLYGDIARFEQQ